MRDRIPPFLLEEIPLPRKGPREGRIRQPLIDKGIRTASTLIVSLFRQEDTAAARGLFQSLDPRVKVLFLLFFAVIVSLKQAIAHEAAIAAFLWALAVSSQIPLVHFYKRILTLTLFFGVMAAFPATLNVVTPGDVLWPVLTLEKDYQFWIYHIPARIGFTAQGMEAMGMLCFRIMNSLTVSFLVLFTTPLPQIVKALQVFRIPAAFLFIITLSLQYIVLFSRHIEDMYLARKSRSVRAGEGRAERMWAAGRIAYLFRKTERRYEEIYRAMTARGYTQEYRFARTTGVGRVDCLALAGFFAAGVLILWL